MVRKRNRKFQLSLSEVATIVVYFPLSHYRDLKLLSDRNKKNLKSEFPKAVSYNRFVELMPNALTVIVFVSIKFLFRKVLRNIVH
ncbi:hypothetical protein LEP1GSC082_2691 [Leptospira kirschneri str. H2]|nr:hypothetical protein LEP1GSC082_2691 [Leptospira kirschneri str. H2]